MQSTQETNSEQVTKDIELIYRLDDKPSVGQSAIAALQHLLAIFVGIITPTLVLSGPLELDMATTIYLVSMALMVSGVATFIQCESIR
jgi:xanthine permease XanP